jgi:hypothetical protein
LKKLMTANAQPDASLRSHDFTSGNRESHADKDWVFGRWSDWRIWVYVILTLCIARPLLPGFFARFSYLEGRVVDYYQEWSSARSVLLHQPVYQQTIELLRRDFDAGIVDEKAWIVGYNVHPPPLRSC